MNAGTKQTVFKIVSIVFVVLGVIAAIGALIALFGAFAAMTVNVGAGLLVLLLGLISVAGGLLQLLMGIWGVQRKNLGKARKLSFVLLVINVVSLVLALIQGSFAWSSLVGLALLALYYYCIK